MTQAAAVSPRIAPSSLISPSEARRLRVINSPPDTNLFQLLRGRGKTNTHISHVSVSRARRQEYLRAAPPLRGLDSRLKGLLFMTCVTSTFLGALNGAKNV